MDVCIYISVHVCLYEAAASDVCCSLRSIELMATISSSYTT